MSVPTFLILYFVVTITVCFLKRKGDTYKALGSVNAAAATIIMYPILRDIMTEPDCSAMTRLVLLLIFGSPIWLSYLVTSPFVALFVSVTDRAEQAVAREIRKDQRK